MSVPSCRQGPHRSRAIDLLQGFLLPLCAAGDCSLREAVIVAAVLRRVSLPVPSSLPLAYQCTSYQCTNATTSADTRLTQNLSSRPGVRELLSFCSKSPNSFSAGAGPYRLEYFPLGHRTLAIGARFSEFSCVLVVAGAALLGGAAAHSRHGVLRHKLLLHPGPAQQEVRAAVPRGELLFCRSTFPSAPCDARPSAPLQAGSRHGCRAMSPVCLSSCLHLSSCLLWVSWGI
jgi:Bystin